MLNYYNFLNESSIKKKPTRKDLNVGNVIKTMGLHDNVDLNEQIGIIIEMKEYGYILVQFLVSFDKKLHAGHKDIGKNKHCFYIKLDNIFEIINNDVAEKIKNKSVIPYKATKQLLMIFKRMKFEPTEEYLDVSYFDIDKDNDEFISYLPSKKFEGDPETKKGRQTMKVGRILRKLKPSLSEKDIEDLITSYRAAFNVIVLGGGKNLEVVTGEDIRYWYSNERYAKNKYTSSELWNSCMSQPSTSPVFNLYCENPDKIALCIYTNEDDKLLARALVWKLDNGDVYMDRIYAISPEDKKILSDYADKNKMKSYLRGNGKMEVTLPKDYGRKHRPINGNPYMDTFKYACVDKNNRYYLCNIAQDSYHGVYR